jgi:hypothetical protein
MEKLSERLHSAIINELGYGMAFEQLQPETQALLKGVVALEAERDSLDKTIHNLVVVNGDALAKVTRLESRLTRVDELLSDNYPCYDKDGCKNCSGDADEIDYKSCVGYNTLTALRVGVE